MNKYQRLFLIIAWLFIPFSRIPRAIQVNEFHTWIDFILLLLASIVIIIEQINKRD